MYYILLGFETRAVAQGSAVIMPMSQYLMKQEKTASFNVHNQLKNPMTMDVAYECEVDGVAIKSDECTRYFNLKISNEINPKKFEIQSSGSVEAYVQMIQAAKRYALFKPVFSPIVAGDSRSNSVAFDFSYQPGILYILNADPVSIATPKFSTRVTDTEKIAVFDLDLQTMTMPAVASISAKIMDKDSKKMMRFVRLASDKIIDPYRKTVTLEAGYAPPKDTSNACFEVIIQWLSTKSLQKLSNCHM
jgi:hypothetical protein